MATQQLIKIDFVQRYDAGYFMLNSTSMFPCPASMNGLNDKARILTTYNSKYALSTIDGLEYILVTNTQRFSADASIKDITDTLEAQYTIDAQEVNSIRIASYTSLSGLSFDGTSWK